ncbi:DUF1963 domain-containing protein [Streptomyces uncialis]|uniref:DUF1963 domain-containing protein n=1 Tax=Streptomyces uncialis TaxID=1048205 RepID=UPI00386E4FA2|nr:DUF1963 domain-containing protein [Streptomyces uncialis]
MIQGPHRTPLDVGELIPGLAALAMRTTMLSPKPGAPGVGDSSIGGPLLWPAGEPWPYCEQPGHRTSYDDESPAGPVPVVPVVQLFARDVPELRFPEGKDVLQVVWCPLIHPDELDVALPALHWRDEAEARAAGVLRDVPQPPGGEYELDFMPRPACTLTPTVVVDYPDKDLPGELLPYVVEFEEKYGSFYNEVACVSRNKVGGYPAWTQPPDWPYCDEGHRMEHLLSVTGEEHLDMAMGDAGGIYLFLCRQCPELPSAYRYDCH